MVYKKVDKVDYVQNVPQAYQFKLIYKRKNCCDFAVCMAFACSPCVLGFPPVFLQLFLESTGIGFMIPTTICSVNSTENECFQPPITEMHSYRMRKTASNGNELM